MSGNLRNQFKDKLRILHVKWLCAKSSILPEIEISGKTVIVAPHPDDEVIGCGGLIARLVSQKNIPDIIVMTGGEGSHLNCCDLTADEIVCTRRALTRKALGELGVPVTYIHELNYSDRGIDVANSAETNKLAKLISELNPENIFVPHWGEGWKDHINTANIIKKIINSHNSHNSLTLYEYCVWMWYYNIWRDLDWKNAYMLKLSDRELHEKLKAMECYIDPVAPCGKPWSGVLPGIFKSAHKKGIELYFKCK